MFLHEDMYHVSRISPKLPFGYHNPVSAGREGRSPAAKLLSPVSTMSSDEVGRLWKGRLTC